MSAARKSQVDLGKLIEGEMTAETPADTDTQATQHPQETPEAQDSRPRADEVVSARKKRVTRTALNVDVPDALELHKRGHLYRLNEGTDMRDQVALAYDTWLRDQGY